LKFNDQQFNALNRAYGQAYTKYNIGVGRIGNTLTEQERAQKLQDLRQAFNQDLNKAVQDTLTDQQQRQRFGELYWQYQGAGAFSDPQVRERLKLNDEQFQRLNQLNDAQARQMAELTREFQKDPEVAGGRFDKMRRQQADQINAILNAQQQQSWRQMMGEPYTFQPGVFFPGSTVNQAPRSK
jgi:hypothetical protein